jgi:hypothetical protein
MSITVDNVESPKEGLPYRQHYDASLTSDDPNNFLGDL